MKIDAKVVLNSSLSKEVNYDCVTVPVDIDYVEDNYDSVQNWVINELEAMFKRPIMNDDVEIINMHEIVEEIAFNDFSRKTE